MWPYFNSENVKIQSLRLSVLGVSALKSTLRINEIFFHYRDAEDVDMQSCAKIRACSTQSLCPSVPLSRVRTSSPTSFLSPIRSDSRSNFRSASH
jgi:hypothetical protein